MPAIQSYFIEPTWEQFCALLPEGEVNHPLGCHHPRIPDRIVFEKLAFRCWCSAALSGGSRVSSVRTPRQGVGATSGSSLG